jgi:hypothetical protein
MVKIRPNVAAHRSVEARVPANEFSGVERSQPKPTAGAWTAAVVDPKPMQGRSRAELSREVRFALDAFAGQGTSTLRRPRMTQGRSVPFICG